MVVLQNINMLKMQSAILKIKIVAVTKTGLFAVKPTPNSSSTYQELFQMYLFFYLLLFLQISHKICYMVDYSHFFQNTIDSTAEIQVFGLPCCCPKSIPLVIGYESYQVSIACPVQFLVIGFFGGPEEEDDLNYFIFQTLIYGNTDATMHATKWPRNLALQ